MGNKEKFNLNLRDYPNYEDISLPEEYTDYLNYDGIILLEDFIVWL